MKDEPSPRSIRSGVSGFDNLIGGGLQEASVTLLFGPSGSGKTAFGLNFLNEVNAGEPGLLFGFYETPARLRAKATSLGLDIEAHVDADYLDILWNPMTENLLDKLGHQLLHAVRSRNVKRLLIDGLGGFERAAVHQPRMNEFFSALINELRALGVTTIATWELQDLFGPTVTAPGSELSSLMDNLIMLRHVEKDSRYRKALSILKVRDSAYDPGIRELIFGNNGIEVDVPLEPVLHAATGLAAPVSG